MPRFAPFAILSAFFAASLRLAPGKNLTAKNAKEMHPTGASVPHPNTQITNVKFMGSLVSFRSTGLCPGFEIHMLIFPLAQVFPTQILKLQT